MGTEDVIPLTRQELEKAIERLSAELADLEEERQMYLGQTGVHIGVMQLQRVRQQFEREEARLRERLEALKQRLGALHSEGH